MFESKFVILGFKFKLIFQSVNTAKNLITLLEGSNKWITKIEDRLCSNENKLEVANFIELTNSIKRILAELDVILIFNFLFFFYFKI
jgi:hypothetical protein